MTIDLNKTKIDLFANIDKMATPNKNKKVVGKPYKVVTLNNVNNVGGNGFIIMKCYYTQSSNTIELTLKHDDFYHLVVGKATSYGYHRESAALQDALDNLNVTLFDDDTKQKQKFIDGRGEEIMCHALLAIAKTLKWESTIMNEVYL